MPRGSFQFQPGFITMERVRVLTEANSGTLRAQKLNDTGASGQITVSILKHAHIPAVGATGIIAYTPIGNELRAYWIDEEVLNSEQAQSNIDRGNSSDEIFFTNNDNTASLKVSKNLIQITNPSTQIASDQQAFTLVHSGQLNVRMNSSLIEARNERNIFRLGQNSTISTETELSVQGTSGLNLKTNGSLIISSGVQNPNESNDLSRLGSINTLIIKASDARVAVGGIANMDAGAFTLNVTSRRLLEPGTSTTFKLNVVQGDAMVTLGTGNFDLNALGPTSFTSMTAGSFSTGLYSRLKMTRLYGEFRNFVSGLVAEVKVQRGDVEINATKGFTADAKASFELNTKGTGKINTIGKLDITATGMMNLESSAIMSVSALMLKMQDARMINLGSPRVAAPNPSMSGGWCAIAMCPFAMTPHCGDILVG
jgi:hypothetical protein